MDVQRTVPYRNIGSGSGNLYLLTVDQEIRKKKYRICRRICCTWRTGSVFLNPYSFGFMVMSCVTRAIGLAPLNAVVFSMVGDVVEFGQWKNHIRQESLIFAGGSIGTKVGAGLASAVITGLLSSSGYVSSSAGITAQPETALEMIVSLYKFGPILIAAVIIVTLFGYKLDKMYPAIMQELTEREAHGQL